MTRKPPFRAEHVGSLLRPRSLYDARAAFDGDLRRTVRAGEGRSSATLRPIEDAAILEAVALQERVGLRARSPTASIAADRGIRTSFSAWRTRLCASRSAR